MNRREKPAPAPPPVWPRSDPAELALFDPRTKRCTMNCGRSTLDPRSQIELKFQCDDCEVIECPS